MDLGLRICYINHLPSLACLNIAIDYEIFVPSALKLYYRVKWDGLNNFREQENFDFNGHGPSICSVECRCPLIRRSLKLNDMWHVDVRTFSPQRNCVPIFGCKIQ